MGGYFFSFSLSISVDLSPLFFTSPYLLSLLLSLSVIHPCCVSHIHYLTHYLYLFVCFFYVYLYLSLVLSLSRFASLVLPLSRSASLSFCLSLPLSFAGFFLFHLLWSCFLFTVWVSLLLFYVYLFLCTSPSLTLYLSTSVSFFSLSSSLFCLSHFFSFYIFLTMAMIVSLLRPMVKLSVSLTAPKNVVMWMFNKFWHTKFNFYACLY